MKGRGGLTDRLADLLAMNNSNLASMRAGKERRSVSAHNDLKLVNDAPRITLPVFSKERRI